MDLNMLLAMLGGGQGGEQDEGNVKKLHSTAEWKAALKDAGDKLVAVDFSAGWCMPCKMISPVFNDLSTKYLNVVFLNIDVDECREVAGECQIRAMPTFQFFRHGDLLDEFSGADPAQLEKHIREKGGVADPAWDAKKKERDAKKLAALEKQLGGHAAGTPSQPKKAKTGGPIIEIESKDQFQEILDKSAGKLVIADWYADWCSPCRRIHPVYEKLANEFKDVTFVQINADELPEVCDQCEVTALPTFCAFVGRGKVAVMTGADPAGLRKLVTKNKP